jgi:uncharacterized membrane protein
MRRINLFLILTIISIASLVAVVLAGYFVLSTTQNYHTNWMGQMWQGMMGGNGVTQMQVQNPAAPFFGFAFVVLVAVSVLGIVGLVYFALFPEIRIARTTAQPDMALSAAPAAATVHAPEKTDAAPSPYESVAKTLTGDERKVVEVLISHGGKYLQKYIRNEAGLSRLQTHRIVARLAERGIVTLEKTGNTNTVLLANWLK